LLNNNKKCFSNILQNFSSFKHSLGQVRKYYLRQGLTHWRSLRPDVEAGAEAQRCCGICRTGMFMSSSLATVPARREQTVSAAAAARAEEALALSRAVTSSSKLVRLSPTARRKRKMRHAQYFRYPKPPSNGRPKPDTHFGYSVSRKAICVFEGRRCKPVVVGP
jgi:hypothetical protein